MKWNITVRPYSSALDLWSWTAVREDQENQRSGAGYDTKEQAQTAAQAEVQEFEDNQGVINAATTTYVFEPVIPAPPEVFLP